MTILSYSKGIINRQTVVSLTLLLSFSGAGQLAVAQDAGSMGSYSPSSTIGPDQDSLLPPEVVPLDPSAANSLVSSQAESRQAQLTDSVSDNVPGLVNAGPSGMQTAQDFRKAAFNSLCGQGQLPQQPLNQWRAGQVNQDMGSNSWQTGQNQMGANSFGNQPYPQGQNMMAAQPAQSQTLTGGVKNKPKVHDIRRGGFSNALSAVAGFGAGALTAGALIRPYSPLVGMGMFGMTMTGFGVRNAFRF